ncbi:TPA: DUF2213 domain-containing protein [Klebsiella variicola]
MPVKKVKGGWRWGNHGKVYPTKEEAEEQERAAYANGYAGDESVDEYDINSLPDTQGAAHDGWITKNGGHVLIGKNGEVKRPTKSDKPSQKSKPSLTPTEKTYLSSYSGDDFLRINTELRNGNESAEGVQKLDSAIDKNSVGVRSLYRGMSKDDAKKLFPDGVIKKGMVISDKGYASTSKRKDIAGMFSVGGVMLQIDSSPDAKGIDMSLLSSNKHEEEVLLPRNAQMVVESIHPPKEPGKPVIVKVSYGASMARDSALIFDEGSRRRIDENGYLHVTQTHLTKEQVAPYYGREIPGWEALELDPDRVYYGYRSGEELEKAKDTFNGMPLLIIHKQDSAHSPLKEERVGSIGTTPVWSPPYLDNALSVTDQSAIDAINDESLKEISCGYFFEPDFTPGEFNGIPYDFVMRNLRGNHVALVKEGRAGPEVSVHDGMPSQLKKVQSMQLTKKQALVMGNLAAYLKPRLAQDAAPADLAKLVTSYKKPGNLVKAVVRQYGNQLAQDMDIEPEELAELMEAAEAVPESVVDNEADPMGQEDDTIFDEENPLESIKAILGGKVPDDILEKVAAVFARPTGDEDPEDKKEEKAEEKEEKKEAAMDANTIKHQARVEAQAHFRSLSEAGRAVRELVGELDVMAFDSAEDIYGHALKQKGVNIKNYDKAAYKGMVDIMAASKPATNPAPAFDSASATSFDGQFAGLKNIKIR